MISAEMLKPITFKHISCYCSTNFTNILRRNLKGLNTYHVIVQLVDEQQDNDIIQKFKYILC